MHVVGSAVAVPATVRVRYAATAVHMHALTAVVVSADPVPVVQGGRSVLALAQCLDVVDLVPVRAVGDPADARRSRCMGDVCALMPSEPAHHPVRERVPMPVQPARPVLANVRVRPDVATTGDVNPHRTVTDPSGANSPGPHRARQGTG